MLAVKPVTAYELVVGEAMRVPSLYTLYPDTPTLSVEASHERVTPVCVRDDGVIPVGVDGGVVSAMELDTVTVMLLDVVVFPAASLATAVSVWEPLDTPTVFHEPEYGATVSSVPRLAPSSLNWTPATPTLSEANATRETEPWMVEPVIGFVMEIFGAVKSVDTCVVAPAEVDWLELFPAASYAATVYE